MNNIRFARSRWSSPPVAWSLVCGLLWTHSAIASPHFSDVPLGVVQEATKQEPSDLELTYQQAAVASQNKNDFQIAASHWERLLKDFPKSSLRIMALHQLGLCEVQLGKHEEAVEHLREAIKGTSPEEEQTLARSQLYLGVSQLQLGKKAQATNNPTEANQWLTTAIVSLNKVLDDYPKFESLNEAAYFRGVAYEQMGKASEAIDSYAMVLDHADSPFRFDALYALGDLEMQRQNYEEAVKHLKVYLQEGQDLPAIDEVRMRAGEATWQLAVLAEGTGDTARQQQLGDEAIQLLSLAANNEQFSRRDEATFKLAMLQSQRDQVVEAMANFESVANNAASTLSGIASLNLGRLHLARQDHELATRWLQKAIEKNDATSPSAVHWLAKTLIASEKPDQVATLVTPWLEKNLDAVLKSELMMDRAEAAFAIPAQQVDSIDLFADVAKAGQKNAPVALYNAAYAALVTKSYERALSFAEQFEAQHENHEYLPDVLEVRAESLVGLEKPTDAAQVFQRLTEKFPQHTKHEEWTVRTAAVQFAADDFAGVEAGLAAHLEQIKNPALLAEAWHWRGAALLQRGELAQAVAAFTNSTNAGVWTQPAQTLLLKSEALIALGQVAEAEDTIAKLEANFPKREETARALYLLAEHFTKSDNRDQAAATFEKISKLETSGVYSGYAQLKQGWFAVDKQDWEAAKLAFQSTLSTAGEDLVLANKARLGLATVAKSNKQFETAQALIEEILAKPANELLAIDAQYELGLIHVANQNWDSAKTIFMQLLQAPEAAGIELNVRYELAWVLQQAQELEAANEQFKILANQFGETPMGADAHFQLGERAYAAQDYPEAIKAYELAAKHGPSALQEKAIYRMGWAHYRLEDFVSSRNQFQKQTDQFPSGPLYADGLYMLAEASFKQNDFDSAIAAYRVARPVIEKSTTFSRTNFWLSSLHAAQSANKVKQYDDAKKFAQALTEDKEADPLLVLDAHLELGLAAEGLKDRELAKQSWLIAAADRGKTGIHARCLYASALFAEKKYESAILEFSLAQNGYGGDEQDPEIDPWQALATYEIGRCKYAQAVTETADTQLQRHLLNESLQDFQELIQKFPQDKLVNDAQRQIATVKKALGELN